MRLSVQNIIGCVSVIFLCVSFTACDNYDEVPPMNETTSSRTYYIAPPTVMSSAETAEYNSIVAEYEASTKKIN